MSFLTANNLVSDHDHSSANMSAVNNNTNNNNISNISAVSRTAASKTPQPRPRNLPPMASSNKKYDDDYDDFDDSSSSESDEDDGIGGRKKKTRNANNQSGISIAAQQRKKRRNQEISANQKMDEMKNMGVLSKFFDWNERPRPDVPTRIKVSHKYHEKLLKIRTSEIAKGKTIGQGIVTDHLCLHQLEPFREMDHMTRSLFMRGVRKPLPSTIDSRDSKQRTQIMSKASKELATAQELDSIIAIVQPPPMKFAMS